MNGPIGTTARVSIDGPRLVSPIWLRDGTLIGLRLSPSAETERMVHLDPTGTVLGTIRAPEHSGCLRTEWAFLPGDPEGTEALAVLECPRSADPPWVYLLVAVDPASGRVDIGRRLDTSEPGGFDLITDLTSWGNGAIATYGDRVCGSLAFIGVGAPQPLHVELPDGEGSLDAFFNDRFDGSACQELGIAGFPSEGSSDALAFGASTAATGVTGVGARLATPWSIFVVRGLIGTAVEIVPDVTFLGDVVWSPDGSDIAFTGVVSGVRGVWLVRADGTQLRFVSDESVQDVSWSPDGRSLAAVMDHAPCDLLVVTLP